MERERERERVRVRVAEADDPPTPRKVVEETKGVQRRVADRMMDD